MTARQQDKQADLPGSACRLATRSIEAEFPTPGGGQPKVEWLAIFDVK